MASRGPGFSSRPALVAAGLAALVAVVFLRVRGFGFVNLDDAEYVTKNPVVLRGLTWDGVIWAFSGFRVANWHPLTWLSHMLDVQLFGPDPGAHHLVNVALHAVDAILLFFFLRSATGASGRSAMVAALFACHPLHVESVAWISERKDVLSTMFLLLTLQAWLAFARGRRARAYAAALAFLFLGLLSKPMLVSTPFLLVLLDAWPLGRFPAAGDGPGRTGVSRLLAEKLPFLALAIAAAAVTWVAQSSGGGSSAVSPIALWPRVANAVVSLVRYPAMAAWPSGLASFYPHPGTLRPDVPLLPVAAAAALVAAACALAVRDWKRRPYLAWGLGWYLVTVAPVIGVVQVGGQALADRYTYVPLVGLLVAVVWWGADGATRLRLPPLAVGALSILVVAAYAAVAWGQVGYWKDSETLHRRSLAVTERNWKAWHGLCDALAEQGRLAEALAACTRAIAALPTFPEAWNTRGVVRARMGSPGDAIPDFERAIALRPDYARAMQNLGAANGNLGRNREASAWFEAALRLRPDDPETLGYLALARALGGDASGAAEALSRLRAVDPGRAASIQARIGP